MFDTYAVRVDGLGERSRDDIVWEYDSGQPGSKPEARQDADRQTGEALNAPPVAELNTLLEFARSGNLKRIQVHVRGLAAQNPSFAAFATRLGSLADNFEESEILRLLEQLIDQQS